MQEYEEFKKKFDAPKLSHVSYSEIMLLKVVFDNFESDSSTYCLIKTCDEKTIHDAYKAACKLIALKKQDKRLQSEVEAMSETLKQNHEEESKIIYRWGNSWL